MRDDLVAALLEELDDLGVGRAGGERGARRRRCRDGRLARRLPRGNDVGLDHAAVRAGARHASRSMPASLASRRASGEAKTRPAPLPFPAGSRLGRRGRCWSGRGLGLSGRRAGRGGLSLPEQRAARAGLSAAAPWQAPAAKRRRPEPLRLQRALVFAFVQQDRDGRIDFNILRALGHQDLADACPRRWPPPPSSPCRSRSRR